MHREIRAHYDADTIRVYQAYPPAIADAALQAGTFAPPFKMGRMTWIKPSFLWMAYRCGYSRKPGQERTLTIDITRDGFHAALRDAALSHFDPTVHRDHAHWADTIRAHRCRVQWDPECDPNHRPLPHRSIQIGLTGAAVRHYVHDWITRITDITELMHDIGDLVRTGNLDRDLLPTETVYDPPPDIAERLGVTPGRRPR